VYLRLPDRSRAPRKCCLCRRLSAPQAQRLASMGWFRPGPPKGYRFARLVGCPAEQTHSHCAPLFDEGLRLALWLRRCRFLGFGRSRARLRSMTCLNYRSRCWAWLHSQPQCQPRSGMADLHLQQLCRSPKRLGCSSKRCRRSSTWPPGPYCPKRLAPAAKHCFAAGWPAGWRSRARWRWRRARPRIASHRNLAPEASAGAVATKRWRNGRERLTRNLAQ
jgi:hypothetical protein